MRRNGLWRQRDFLKLWAAQAVSEIGSRISRTAIPLAAVLVLGATPFQMGILNGAGAAGVLGLRPVGGGVGGSSAPATGVLTMLFEVTHQAYLPTLVERARLLEGNSRLALSGAVAEVAGPDLEDRPTDPRQWRALR